MRPGRGVDHTPYLGLRLKKEYSYTSIPPLGLRSLFHVELCFTLLFYLNFFDLRPLNLRGERSRGVNLKVTWSYSSTPHTRLHDVYKNNNNPFTLNLLLYVTFLSGNIILTCTILRAISRAQGQKWSSKRKFLFNPGCVASIVILVINMENLEFRCIVI
jgi:hypothetical protein